MPARIYQPARNAMQSGKAKTKNWLLEFDADAPREADPLMGWTSSADTRQQLRMRFETKEQAIAYAERNGIAYVTTNPRSSKPKRKAYSDNFRWGRQDNWTH